jgi:tRNA/rRNA methyltransferase
MVSRCRVVLVRPEVAGNIGATARAMRNFGLTELVLVSPVADPLSDESRQRSTHGESILLNARQVLTLDDALAGCIASVAATARTGGLFRESRIAEPGDVVSRVLPLLGAGPVALVFGPEPSGLTNDEVARCDHLLTIPTDPTYPALNLSHAVAVCLYEFRRQWAGSPTLTHADPPAADDEREQMFRHLRSALEGVHFLWNEKADLLFNGLRQLITRAGPTHNEVMLLHGIASQLEWVVRNDYKAPAAPTD